MKLGAASEIDRHALQLSEPCPAVATSLSVMQKKLPAGTVLETRFVITRL